MISLMFSVQGQSLDDFTYISYAKLQKNRGEGYPQIFIDNLSNLNNNIL